VSLEDILVVLLLSLAPVSECRGAIVYGLAKGLDPLLTLVTSIVGNIAPALLLPKVLDRLEFFVARTRLSSLYSNYIDHVRRRVRPYVEKYGVPGLTLFVAIPLPATGVYTGAVAAHVLGIRRGEIALSLGAVAAALLVFAAAWPMRVLSTWA